MKSPDGSFRNNGLLRQTVLVNVFLNSVAHLRQPCSGKGGFETRPYYCYGTSIVKVNAPPHNCRERFQTCHVLRQALNLPFQKGAVS